VIAHIVKGVRYFILKKVNYMKNTLTPLVKAVLIFCGLSLIAVLFVPMWKIELNAPQYPEGLALQIYPHKIGGNVDIINGLNHYIGMKTLHTKDFIEFTVLPYIIGFFALACFAVVFLNKKKWLVTLTILFILFGIIAMYDFWRWEYNYGHDLSPNAAIQVPGMAYQPPLIGYKQLLNFAAYSIPDIGGYIFLAVGFILLLTCVVLILKGRKIKSQPVITLMTLFLVSCNAGPEPIKLGVDNCFYCKMTIVDNRFGAELITIKGKIFKFDDMHCLLSFMNADTKIESNAKNIYLVNFNTHDFIDADKAILLKSDDLRSPMGGNIAAFIDEKNLQMASEKFKGKQINWKELVKQ
jgi:copper chaperone NosL